MHCHLKENMELLHLVENFKIWQFVSMLHCIPKAGLCMSNSAITKDVICLESCSHNMYLSTKVNQYLSTLCSD